MYRGAWMAAARGGAPVAVAIVNVVAPGLGHGLAGQPPAPALRLVVALLRLADRKPLSCASSSTLSLQCQ